MFRNRIPCQSQSSPLLFHSRVWLIRLHGEFLTVNRRMGLAHSPRRAFCWINTDPCLLFINYIVLSAFHLLTSKYAENREIINQTSSHNNYLHIPPDPAYKYHPGWLDIISCCLAKGQKSYTYERRHAINESKFSRLYLDPPIWTLFWHLFQPNG